jgi:hypothetical protein
MKKKSSFAAGPNAHALLATRLQRPEGDPIMEEEPPAGAAFEKRLKKLGTEKRDKSSWVQKYRSMRGGWEEQRAAERALDDEGGVLAGVHALHMAAGSANKDVKLLPPITKIMIMPQQWNDTWKRNTYCEITGLATTPGTRKDCMYCPVVVRLDAFKAVTLKYMSKQWVCPECILDIKANRDELQAERRLQLEKLDLERSARLVQAHIRGWLPRQRYLHARYGATKFSALFRGKQAREHCQQRFSTMRRVMRIKTISAEKVTAADADGTSDPYVHIGVVSGSNSDVQIFHHVTKPKKNTLTPQWHDHFLVPGADGNVTIVFTVIDWDELRNDFLGQAILRFKGTDIWKTGGKFTIDIEEMQITPKERNRTAMRLGNADAYGGGTITVEIHQLPNNHTVCGFLEEKTGSAGVISVKKFWGVLAEGHLKLYRYYGDVRPNQVIKLTSTNQVTITEKAEPRQKGRRIGRASFELKVTTNGAGVGKEKEILAHATFVPDSSHSAKEWISKIKLNMRHKDHKHPHHIGA